LENNKATKEGELDAAESKLSDARDDYSKYSSLASSCWSKLEEGED
jgi:hypothetical protein